MSEVTPEQLLAAPSIPPEQPVTASHISSGWAIFWLVAFTPFGWYLVWKKTTWTRSVKIIVILITALLVLGLIVETELISSQIAGQLTNLGN